MGDASFRRRAEMLSRPLALLLGIFWIKLKTCWELGMVFEETTGVYERMDHKAILKLPVDW